MGNSGNSLKSCFVCRTNRLNYALDPFHVSRTMQHRETEERKTMKKTKTNEISTHAERHMKHPFFFYCVAFATYEMRQWFSMANTHQIKIILHLHGQVKQIAHSDNGWFSRLRRWEGIEMKKRVRKTAEEGLKTLVYINAISLR